MTFSLMMLLRISFSGLDGSPSGADPVAYHRHSHLPTCSAAFVADVRKGVGVKPKRLDARLPVERISVEIRPLVRTVNQALDRLEHGFNIQREFTADAAHELRTPIAISRNHTEALTDPKVAKALRQDIKGMARIISQLLDIAELDALNVDPAEEADLEAVYIRIIDGLASLALAEGKNIVFSGVDKPVRIKGSEEVFYRVVRNLVENAISHTPSSTTVEVTLANKGELSVLDEGPGRARINFPSLLASRSSPLRQRRSWSGNRSAHRRDAWDYGIGQ